MLALDRGENILLPSEFSPEGRFAEIYFRGAVVGQERRLGPSADRQIALLVVSTQGTLICRSKPHFYFSPLCSVGGGGAIAEHILVSHRSADRSGSFGDLSSVVDGDGTTTGRVSDFTQPRFPQSLFDGVEEECLKQADGIDLHVGFPYDALYFS